VIKIPSCARKLLALTSWQTGTWIKFRRNIRVATLGAFAILAAGCADEHPSTRIVFKDATVNGVPERLTLDTGSAYMVIYGDSSKRAGMEIFLQPPPTVDQRFESMTLALAKPADVNLGGVDNSVQPLVGNLARFSLMVDAKGERLDGLISWPEVRDNILVFDGPEHKVQSVDTLPIDPKAGWSKFPIGPNNQLTLMTAFANGQVGTILVDTGSYIGVALPMDQWKKWRAAHPNAPSGSLEYLTPGQIGVQSVEEAWADEITIGGLTLTDVPVHPADPVESNNFGNTYAGTLGLYALARLEFVVDGKDGVVYARPRPKPGPYYPGIERADVEKDPAGGPLGQDWMIEGKVVINPSHIRHFSGEVLAQQAINKYQNGDQAGAMAECIQAIAYDAKNDNAFAVRGVFKLKQNDDQGGLADVNHALELNPYNAWAYDARGEYKYQHDDAAGAIIDCSSAIAIDRNFISPYMLRGASRQVQNDTVDAMADYDRVCQLYPDTDFPQLYFEVLQRWQGGAPRDLSAYIASWPNDWAKAIGNYLANRLSESELMTMAANGRDPLALTCQAYYFSGFVHFLNKDLTGARERWQKGADCQTSEVNDRILARAMLKVLDSATKQ
jgi:tetratricopeptide (TPR) repeat protein